MIVLKLGGSVVTRKGEPETVDAEALGRAADALAGVDDLVLVHGGGSFGHPHAEAHGISPTDGSRDAPGVYAVHDAMRRLNDAVLARLHERGVPALPVHPLSAAARDADGALDLPTAGIEAMLGEGFLPVTHGDVIAHAGRGATVVSGDELAVALAGALSAERVGLCSSVPGVLDASGEVVPRIESYGGVENALGGSEDTDVTGGMAAKVRALLELDAPARVFGPDDLESFLSGGSPGTLIAGSRSV